MGQCCDDPLVAFTLAFQVPGSPREPADGSPLEAYFDRLVDDDRGIEMDHPLTRRIALRFDPTVGPVGEGDTIVTGPPVIDGDYLALWDVDDCERPQLAFAIGVVLSGSD
jgi:hypothetical protein